MTDDKKTSHPYPKAAGGIDAVLSSTRHALEQMGPIRAARALYRVNQPGGFDCPGCAWPDPQHPTIGEFCENGAKAVADEATNRRIDAEFFAQWPISALLEQSDHWLGNQGRLTQPMVRRPQSDHYEPISWPEAFALIASELRALEQPDQAIFYTSGRTSNEAAFLYQLFVRLFGTNNLPDCSNMCHESSGVAMVEALGVGKGTVSLEDFELADVIVILGQNPGTNHPRMLSSLQAAKRRGAKIISINPLKEAGLVRFKHPKQPFSSATELTDLYLQVRINGDVALLKGIMRELLDEEQRCPGEVFDHAFIAEHTAGFEQFTQALQQVKWTEIIAQSGISRQDIRAAADIIGGAKNMICCWAMGLTQHKNAVANIQEVINLLLLRGAIGRPGAGACPVRGHSNVQGDRTMGIWERPPAAFLDRLGKTFDFAPPREHGFDTVEAIKAMHHGRAHVFLGMGGNFLSATPDTALVAEALGRCRLTAHVSTKLNRSHLVCGHTALILPCLGRTETDLQDSKPQFVTVENSMGVVHASRGRLAPASEHLLSEPAIVAKLAMATLADCALDWQSLIDDYDRIRDLIERTIDGFEDFNQRVRTPFGFTLPNAARERRFETATQKANFTVHRLPDDVLLPGQLLMMTIRSHDQYNTTIYGLDDRYRGIKNARRIVLLNPEDIAELGFEPEQSVDLHSHFAGELRIAPGFTIVAYDMPRRSAATYFPEANVLVPIDHVATRSNTPASKSVVITLANAR
ncbi:MAG: FdhF/YdeP family oxidoreductase [Bradymonadaceae bacterium]|nr:FdhF/YdeP family oxidoreductase [Lujinxingiaceae bacterium]